MTGCGKGRRRCQRLHVLLRLLHDIPFTGHHRRSARLGNRHTVAICNKRGTVLVTTIRPRRTAIGAKFKRDRCPRDWQIAVE